VSYFYNRLVAAVRRGAVISDQIVQSGLTDREAFDLEVEVIASFPPKQLWNTTTGGGGLSSESAKAMWKRPAHRKRVLAALNSPKAKKANSETVIALWKDPEWRERVCNRDYATAENNPEWSKNVGAALVLKWQDPVFYAQMQESQRKAWKEGRRTSVWEAPGFREKWMKARWGK
jgi:hypothetical protein